QWARNDATRERWRSPPWRRGGGAACDQLDGERNERRALRGALDQRDQGVGGGTAEAGLVLSHRGQRRVEVGGDLDVVEADDGKVLGDAETDLGGRPDGAE